MDTTDSIAMLSMNMAATNVQNQASTMLIRKGLDTQNQEVAQLLEQLAPQADGKGETVDTYA